MTLDPREILAALGVTGVTAATPVTGGYDAAIWRVEARGRTYALRAFPPQRRGGFRLEVAAMRAAAAGGLPVPTLETTGEWAGHPAMLISWCEGRPQFAELMRQPWRLTAMARAAGRAQARVHRVPAPPELLDSGRDWRDYPVTDRSLVDLVLARQPRQDALLHMDLHPLNLLADGSRVTAIIDWTNACAGDPRLDVARSITFLRLAPVPGLGGLLLAPLRWPLAAAWLRGYEAEAGRLHDMAPFYAWAGSFLYADLAAKFGKPGVPFTPQNLAPALRWVTYWKERAAP